MLYVSFMVTMVLFFFFKQKTAYEMRISDWSSDVCSSDLQAEARQQVHEVADSPDLTPEQDLRDKVAELLADAIHFDGCIRVDAFGGTCTCLIGRQIGRASCRERVCQSV